MKQTHMGGIETIPRPLITETVEITTVEEIDDSGNKRFKHLVIGGEAAIVQARVNGTNIEALCGFKWKPSGDPLKYPACPECLELEKHLPYNDPKLPRRLA